MIGEKIRFEDLPQDGLIIVNKKKVYWYDHYKWDNMEQYIEWKSWAREQLLILGEKNTQYVLDYADLRYGLNVRLKKEGSLF